jgi:hypothetical protein
MNPRLRIVIFLTHTSPDFGIILYTHTNLTRVQSYKTFWRLFRRLAQSI